MAVPTWLSALGHFFGDVLGGVIGARLGGADWRQKAPEEVMKGFQRVLILDRENVMKELLLLGDEGAELVALLREANRRGFITVRGVRYTENWIVNMLLKIEPQDRQWVYPLLNELCLPDREELFTFLEILYNDGWLQWLQVAKEIAAERLGPAIRSAMGSARNLNTKLSPARGKLRRQAATRGWRSWTDC